MRELINQQNYIYEFVNILIDLNKMTMPTSDSIAPDFALPSTQKDVACLADYKGRYLVLYFYPKDSTPGCTAEAIDFTALKDDFNALGADILGVSKDSMKRHTNFTFKNSLGINLASDIEGTTLEAYGVWVEKKNYGRTYMGIQRSSFLIGPDGIIVHVWPKVRVKGHAEAVFDYLKTLEGS